MTGQILTVLFPRAFRACGIEYGLMHAVATLYFAAIARPSEMLESVIVGWRREWSIIFARRGRDTLAVNISEDELMMASLDRGGIYCLIKRIRIGVKNSDDVQETQRPDFL